MLTEIDEPVRIETTIAVWADGTWCYPYEIPQMYHMSDDYAFIHPAVVDEDDIEDAVQQYIQS